MFREVLERVACPTLRTRKREKSLVLKDEAIVGGKMRLSG